MQRKVAEHVPVLSSETEATLSNSELVFRRLLDKLPAGAYTCDPDGLITYFNQHAEQLWGRQARLNDPRDRFCGSFKLFSPDGNPINHDQCWMALALRNGKGYNGHEIIVERPGGQRLTVLAHANPIHDESGKLVASVNVLVDITQQKEGEEAVQRLNESLKQQVARRAAAQAILHDIAMAANQARTIDDALMVGLRRICEYNDWLLGHVWRRAEDNRGELVSSGAWHAQPRWNDDSLREFQRITEKTRIPIGDGFVGRVAGSGEPCWLHDVNQFLHWHREDPRRFGLTSAIAFPVYATGEVVAVLEFFSDKQMERGNHFMEIMANVGIQLGHVFERKRLEKTIADASAEQQRRISRDLHDSVSQLLTGVGMMGESLRQVLEDESSPHVKLAVKLVECLSEAQRQVRRISRGLMPVETDAASLMKALERLTDQCLDLYNVACRLECDEPVLVADNGVATQVYFIVCEALHNAVKHSGASSIIVRLENSGTSMRLVVQDDGVGAGNMTDPNSGMGLPIMRYRAGVIDAKLDVVTVDGVGTKVICTVPMDRINQ